MATINLKEQLLKAIGEKNYYTFSTCNYPNWNREEHFEALRLKGQWPEGYNLSYQINHGVHDWTLLKTN